MSDDLKAFLADCGSDQFRYFRGYIALTASAGLGPHAQAVQKESAKKMEQLRSARREASLALARAEAQIKDEEIGAILRMNTALDADQVTRRCSSAKDVVELEEAICAASIRIAIAQSNLEGWERIASTRALTKEENNFRARWASKLDAALRSKASLTKKQKNA